MSRGSGAGQQLQSLAVTTGPAGRGRDRRRQRPGGKPLQRELAGRWTARRGGYRVLYAIDEEARRVTVLAADHRRDVYRHH